GFECLTCWIGRIRSLILRKLHLLRRCGLPASFLPSHLFFLALSLADFLGLFLFELLFLDVKSSFRFSQPIQSVSLLPDFLLELVPSLFRTAFVISCLVDLGGLVEDVLDFVGNLLTSAILVEWSVALDGRRVQGDFSHLSHTGFSAKTKDLDEE